MYIDISKRLLRKKLVIDFCLTNEILDLAAIFLQLIFGEAIREIVNWQLILYIYNKLEYPNVFVKYSYQ